MNKLIHFPDRPSKVLRAAAVEKKGVPMFTYPAQLFFGIADKLDENSLRGLQAYAVSAIAYSCMRFRATKLIEAPLWVAEETHNGEEWLSDHPLAEVLERPNDDMEMADLLELTQLYLDGAGSALWLKTRDRSGRVAKLYPFSRDEFSVQSDGTRLYARFSIATRAGNKEFPAEDVVFFRNADPRNVMDGLAPLSAALAHVNMGQSLKDAVRAQLKRAIRPGSSITLDQPFSDEDERTKFKAALISQFAGAMNTGNPMVLEGAKLEQLPWTLKDLSLGPVQGDIEAAVCSAFQVHPALIGSRIGIENSSAWADTIASALNIFYDLFGFPTWSRFEKTLTRELLREADPDTSRFIRFDKTKIRALQADVTKKTTEANQAANYWTVNERRVHTGQPALPDDDERGNEIGNASNAFADLFSGGKMTSSSRQTKARKETRVIIGGKSPSVEVRTALWKAFDRLAMEQERKFEREATEQFRAEKASIAQRIEQLPKALDEELDKLVAKLAGDYSAGGTYYDEWYRRYLALIGETVKLGGDGIAAQLGFDFSLSNPKVQAAIAKRANLLAGNVSDTTYQMIKEIIAAGVRDGESARQIADSINEDVFGDLADIRAIRIARTESIGALNAGEHMSAALSGVIQSKEWLTQGDDRVRDSHASIDGERVAMDALFANGLEYPGDQRGAADEVINCRCTLLYHDELGKSRSVTASFPVERKSETSEPQKVEIAIQVRDETKRVPLKRTIKVMRDKAGNLLGDVIETDAHTNGNGAAA